MAFGGCFPGCLKKTLNPDSFMKQFRGAGTSSAPFVGHRPTLDPALMTQAAWFAWRNLPEVVPFEAQLAS